MKAMHLDGWVRDEALERKLAASGVPFHLATMSVSELDLQESIKNSGRIGEALNKKVVSEYACSMIDGDQFPAVVVGKNGHAKHLVIAGNHRVHGAIEAERKHVLAYVLDTADPAVWSTLARTDNARNGDKPSTQDRCRAAKYLIDRYGLTHSEAARLNKIDDSTMSLFMRAEAVRKEVVKANLPASKLLDGQAAALSPLFNANLRVGVEAARIVLRQKMTGSNTTELVRHARKGEDEAEMIERLRSFAERLRLQSQSPQRMLKTPRRTALLSALTRLRAAVADAANLEALQITEEADVSSVRNDLRWLAKRLNELCRG